MRMSTLHCMQRTVEAWSNTINARLNYMVIGLMTPHSWSELENSFKMTVNAEVWCFKRIFRKSEELQIIKIIQQAVFNLSLIHI